MKEIIIEKLKELPTKDAKYNFTREYLQELILQIIDRQGYFRNLAFVGGTALRILYDLPRFSEDLDFSLVNRQGFSFPALLKTIKTELELNGFFIEEVRSKEKAVLAEFIRFKGLLYELGLSSHKNEKLFVKLEIDSNPPAGFEDEIVLINKNFLFKVRCYKPDSLFASKLHAVLFRKYEKGRDYYDLLWFLTKKIPINYVLLANATAQTEKTFHQITPESTKKLLLDKIEKINFSRVLNDIQVFLENATEVGYLKKEYFIGAIEKYFA